MVDKLQESIVKQDDINNAIIIVAGAIKEKYYLVHKLPDKNHVVSGYNYSKKLYFTTLYSNCGPAKDLFSEDPNIVAIEYIIVINSIMDTIKSVSKAVNRRETKKLNV